VECGVWGLVFGRWESVAVVSWVRRWKESGVKGGKKRKRWNLSSLVFGMFLLYLDLCFFC
jgi:hypothetical protein